MGKFFGPKSWQETAGFCRVGWCLSSRRAKKAGIFQGRMSSRHGQWQSCVMVSSAVTQLASEKGPYPLLLCSCLLFLKGYDLSHSLSAPHLTPVPLLRPHTPSHISPHWCTNGQSELFSGFRPRCQAIWRLSPENRLGACCGIPTIACSRNTNSISNCLNPTQLRYGGSRMFARWVPKFLLKKSPWFSTPKSHLEFWDLKFCSSRMEVL